ACSERTQSTGGNDTGHGVDAIQCGDRVREERSVCYDTEAKWNSQSHQPICWRRGRSRCTGRCGCWCNWRCRCAKCIPPTSAGFCYFWHGEGSCPWCGEWCGDDRLTVDGR